MTTLSARGRIKTVETGIRAFDIGRDLRPVADLISRSFAQELDYRGTAALREMRMMSHIGSLLKILNRSTGEFNDVFSGFVWVNENKVVGNVTVQRVDSIGRRWHIANVAVFPAFRGQGIASRLVQRAIEHIKEERGEWVSLQVHGTNHVALNLYEKLGFENLGGIVTLRLARVHKGLSMMLNQPPLMNQDSMGQDSMLEPFESGQWHSLYELANSQSYTHTQWWRGLHRTSFHVTIEDQIAEWFWQLMGKRRIYRRCIRTGRKFDSAMVLTGQRWNGVHEIELWTRPNQRGRYEDTFIRWALTVLHEYPRLPVEIKLSTEYPTAIEAFQHYGFTEIDSLLTMRKSI